MQNLCCCTGSLDLGTLVLHYTRGCGSWANGSRMLLRFAHFATPAIWCHTAQTRIPLPQRLCAGLMNFTCLLLALHSFSICYRGNPRNSRFQSFQLYSTAKIYVFKMPREKKVCLILAQYWCGLWQFFPVQWTPAHTAVSSPNESPHGLPCSPVVSGEWMLLTQEPMKLQKLSRRWVLSWFSC